MRNIFFWMSPAENDKVAGDEGVKWVVERQYECRWVESGKRLEGEE